MNTSLKVAQVATSYALALHQASEQWLNTQAGLTASELTDAIMVGLGQFSAETLTIHMPENDGGRCFQLFDLTFANELELADEDDVLQ